jgi:hypothetical protein
VEHEDEVLQVRARLLYEEMTEEERETVRQVLREFPTDNQDFDALALWQRKLRQAVEKAEYRLLWNCGKEIVRNIERRLGPEPQTKRGGICKRKHRL